MHAEWFYKDFGTICHINPAWTLCSNAMNPCNAQSAAPRSQDFRAPLINAGVELSVAGHRLTGPALVRWIRAADCQNLVLRTRADIEPIDPLVLRRFIGAERPEHYVLLAAARIGRTAE